MKHFSVEVVRKQSSHLTRSEIHELVLCAMEKSKIGSISISVDEGYLVPMDDLEHFSPGISSSVESLMVYLEKHEIGGGDLDNGMASVENSNSQMQMNGNGAEVKHIYSIYVYELDLEGEEAEYMGDNDEEEGQSASSHHWLLPSRSFHGLWESLIFESDIKCKLVDYVKTAVMFSTKGVSPALVSWNKVVLLHGPPGTGKTSLCKALAQKAVIRLQDDFLYGQLIEINSHSLFSKWFSESGKLVTKMFDKILELVEDPKALIFLLIDEVESLAQCRQSAEIGNEPTDSIRAVNALLTQIDRVKKYPNVLILTTSNIVGSIDIAFVDRADLKLFIGHPPATVIYGILASCINELIRVGVVTTPEGISLPSMVCETNSRIPFVASLLQISGRAKGLSGRSLRKIPFLTYANYFSASRGNGCELTDFLEAMSTAVDKELLDRLALKTSSGSSKLGDAVLNV
ncbi:unnamed protein product [Orchesella dallaii]|uniref:AAA+ ATPase domain-containing protein n=1 Tax=Orchesella dallaii TaxID=48710 RepID=A0ABP1Q722_9HEXA